jgi:D-threo-aldose 1-dehydrogenase
MDRRQRRGSERAEAQRGKIGTHAAQCRKLKPSAGKRKHERRLHGLCQAGKRVDFMADRSPTCGVAAEEQAMADLERRRIGRTALHVTSLGLGTATMGGSRIPVTREEGERLVRAAWEAGVRYVDTAPFYGVGAAERRVGDALRDRPRDEWVLSTKVGRLLRPYGGAGGSADGRLAPLPFEVKYDYSYDGIMRSVEDSYQRLGLAKIDILFVHDIGVYQHGAEANAAHMKVLRDSGYRALDELRRTGAVGAIGLGVNEKEVLIEVLKFGDWDAFLLAGRYTLLEQDPLDDLLPMCSARGTSIVVGGPLNSGILAGRDTWNYTAAPPGVVARVNALRAVCEAHSVPLAAAALQFPLAHPAVAAIIPGPRSAAEFEANLPLIRLAIPAALWADLRERQLLHPEAPTPS